MLNVQDLRKIFSAQGIKGFGSANRATFTAAIDAAHAEALELNAAMAPVVEAPAKPKKGICNVCDKRRASKNSNGMCEPCYEEGGWENTHDDANHAEIAEIIEHAGHDQLNESDKAEVVNMAACWICHPELNRAQQPLRGGRSRAGMVIIAKGSEIHKSETFRAAAQAAGWSVNVLGSVNIAEDGEEQERFVAVAKKGDDKIELAWNGRAYDYPTSGATFGGKARKVRNLKEALRLL